MNWILGKHIYHKIWLDTIHSSRLFFGVRLWIYSVFLGALSLPLKCQAQNFIRLDHIFYDEGMPSNWVRSIVEDSNGHIWFGGSTGLTRYDGRICKHFRFDPNDLNSLAANYVNHIFYDEENHRVIASTLGGGISILDINNEEFHNIMPRNANGESVTQIKKGAKSVDGHYYFLPNFWDDQLIKVRFEDNQCVYTIEKLENLNFKKTGANLYDMQLVENPIDTSSLLLGINHELYSINLFDFETRLLFAIDISNRLSNETDYFLSINEVNDGKILLTTVYSGIIQLDLSNSSFYNIDCPQGLNCIFTSLYAEPDGLYYLGSSDGKIYTYEKHTKRFEEMQFDFYQFGKYMVKTLFKSKQDVLYFAVGLGVFKYDFSANRFYTVFNQFQTINENKNIFYQYGFLHPELSLYFVDAYNDNRIFVVDLNTSNITFLGGSEGLSSNTVLYTQWRDADLIFLNDGQLYRLNSTYDRIVPISLNGISEFLTNEKPEVSNIYSFGEQSIVVHGDDWIYLYKDENIQYNIDLSQLGYAISSKINSIYFEGEFLYLVTDQKLYKYHLKDKKFSEIYLKGYQAIGNPRFLTLIKVNDVFFLSSFASGFFVLEEKNETFNIIKNFREDNSIISNQITYISLAPDQTFWLATDLGIIRYDPVTEAMMVFSNDHNIKESSIYRPIHVNKNGTLATNTTLEILWSDVTKLTSIKNEAKLAIHSFELMGKELNVRTSLMTQNELRFSYHRNSFKIGWSLLKASRTTYYNIMYYLDGFEEDWKNEHGLLEAEYTSIPPGKYKFKIKAQSRIDHSLIDQIELSFVILSPFYATWWFRSMILLLLVLVLYLAYQWRVQAIKQEEAVKTNYNKQLADLELQSLRARMNPHFMFNSLNSIKLYILKNEKELAAEYLTGFSHLIRSILNHSGEKYITLNDELETILQYIDLEKKRISGGFDFQMNIEESLDKNTTFVQPLITQPFIENAIWHGLSPKSNNRKLSIHVQRKGGMLEITIEDNGVGRKQSLRNKRLNSTDKISKGIEITRSRMKAMDSGSNIHIEDLYNSKGIVAGTRITLHLPIITQEK
ncbi:MAG TPA: histidine kinase [Saprospiraceae bacterium]|nr:histidine kinase [Saprospiraceae bacterium]